MRVIDSVGLPSHLFAVLEAAFKNTVYDAPKGARTRSVSQLIAPAQAFQIIRDHEAEIEVEVLSTVPALFGSAVHHLLDLAGEAAPTLVREERLTTQYAGWTITGKPDVFVTPDNRLVDYKSSSVWAYVFEKPEWVAQMNLYRWLLTLHGSVVNDMEVDLFCKDWRKGEARQSDDYPMIVQPIPIPKWTTDQTLAYLDERLKRHGETLPPCTPGERWQKPDTWARKKPANKRATAVYPSEAAARAELKTGEVIEHRPGENVRCLGYTTRGVQIEYCHARKWCKQWAADPTNPKNQTEEE